jgi:formate hydrogenlyase subunit 6/NADH:ubiquinone oxidoreductase subunit I
MMKPARVFGEVMRHLFKKPATCSYPFTPAKPHAQFRGRIDFDSAKCIGCQICVRVCPSKAIEIPLSGEQPPAPAQVEGQPAAAARKKFDCIMKLDHCVYCWQCADSCPKQALITTQDFELAQVDKAKLRRHYK